MQDQLILGVIYSSLSVQMLSHVTRCDNSLAVWLKLKTLFQSHSKARTQQVRFKLITLKKGNDSIADYFQKFQILADTLAAIDKPLDDVEMGSFILRGLGSNYDPFVTLINTRVDPLSVEELYGHLLAHEQRLDHNLTAIDLIVAGANTTSRSTSYRGGHNTHGSYIKHSSGRHSASNNTSHFSRG
jgi:hypothetical protein